jgi:hypothetical protein
VELSTERTGKCGICQQVLSAGVLASCPQCRASYHHECWIYNGRRCAVFGCIKDPFPKRRLPAPQRHVDVFNPAVMISFAVAIAGLMWWVWNRLQAF